MKEILSTLIDSINYRIFTSKDEDNRDIWNFNYLNNEDDDDEEEHENYYGVHLQEIRRKKINLEEEYHISQIE